MVYNLASPVDLNLGAVRPVYQGIPARCSLWQLLRCLIHPVKVEIAAVAPSALQVLLAPSAWHVFGVRHGSHCRSIGVRHALLDRDEKMLDRDGCVEGRWFRSL